MKTHNLQPGPPDWAIGCGIVGLLLVTLIRFNVAFFVAGIALSMAAMFAAMFVLPQMWDT